MPTTTIRAAELLQQVDRVCLPILDSGKEFLGRVFDKRRPANVASASSPARDRGWFGISRPTFLKSFCALWVVAALGYAAVAAFFYLFQDHLVFEPESEVVSTPQNRGLAYDDVWLITDDGVALNGWFVPAERPRGVVLYFHGNDGNISQYVDLISYYHRLKLSIFMIDYRGYGKSEGSPSEEGMYRDAEAAWRYLTEQRRLAPKDILIYGRSLGGGAAAYLAARHRAGALVLESTFTSLTDLAAELYPWLPVRQFSRFHYPVKEYLSKVDMPVLIVHSREDDLIPFSEGKQLVAAAPEPRRFLEIRGTHDDGFQASVVQYTKTLDSFVREFLI